MKTLSVTGRGTVSVQTTRAYVELGVEVQGRTAQAVQQKVAQRSEAVTKLLRDRQVENLRMTGICLQPQYSDDRGQERLCGFKGEDAVTFVVQTEQLGTLLDASIALGATRISRIHFTAEDAILAEAHDKAHRAATMEAQSRAATVLESLKLSAEEIVSIQVGTARSFIPEVQAFSSDFATIDGAVPITTDDAIQSNGYCVTAAVTLQISY